VGAPAQRLAVMSAPGVSVVMAVYNGLPYLAAAIDSILAQTLEDIELIIVDDGSTDGSAAVLAGYEKQDARMRVLHQQNAGLAAARNAGIALARGEFIAMMDSDDESLPGRLRRQADFLHANPDVAAVACRCVFIDAEGRVLKVQRERTPLQDAGLPLEVQVRRVIVQTNQTVMLRATVAGELGGMVYRPFFAVLQDFDLSFRLAEKHRLANLNGAPLYRYRQYAPDKKSANLSGRDQALRWHCGSAAVLSAWARQNGRPDPVETARDPRALLPLVAQLPSPIKAHRINDASAQCRRLLKENRLDLAAEIVTCLRALATTEADRRVAGRTLRRILFYAVRGGKWRIVPALTHALRRCRRRG